MRIVQDEDQGLATEQDFNHDFLMARSDSGSLPPDCPSNKVRVRHSYRRHGLSAPALDYCIGEAMASMAYWGGNLVHSQFGQRVGDIWRQMRLVTLVDPDDLTCTSSHCTRSLSFVSFPLLSKALPLPEVSSRAEKLSIDQCRPNHR